MSRASAELLLLSEKDVEELSALMAQVDSVELKLTVPHGEGRSTLDALEAELLDAELRHVYFFDTPELALYRGGVIVRGRDRPGDSVVKLRPVGDAPAELGVRQVRGNAALWRAEYPLCAARSAGVPLRLPRLTDRRVRPVREWLLSVSKPGPFNGGSAGPRRGITVRATVIHISTARSFTAWQALTSDFT